jgi:S1-C subfamily serine protease
VAAKSREFRKLPGQIALKTGLWPALRAGLAALLLLWAAAGGVLAEGTTARDLAREFDGLAAKVAASDGDSAREAAYQAVGLLDRIRAEFPASLEARLLYSKGRLPNRDTDLARIYALAGEWTAAHPELPPFLPAELAIGQPATAEGLVELSDEDAEPPPPPPRVKVAGADLPPPPKLSGDLDVLRPGAAPAAASRPAASAPAAPAPSATAHPRLSEGELHRRLREASVLLFFVGNKTSGGLSAIHVGSGSFIGPDMILTNAHVAEEMLQYSGTWLAISETIGIRAATVVSIARRDTPVNIDAALMRVEGFRSTVWLPLNVAPKLDERIVIAGYPGDAALLDQRYTILQASLEAGTIPARDQLPTALLNEGRINNFISYAGTNSTELQYTMVTAPGNSGSPVVNVCGELVGLHYSGGAKAAQVKFNGAVHAREVALYLQTVGIPVTASAGACLDDK